MRPARAVLSLAVIYQRIGYTLRLGATPYARVILVPGGRRCPSPILSLGSLIAPRNVRPRYVANRCSTSSTDLIRQPRTNARLRVRRARTPRLAGAGPHNTCAPSPDRCNRATMASIVSAWVRCGISARLEPAEPLKLGGIGTQPSNGVVRAPSSPGFGGHCSTAPKW